MNVLINLKIKNLGRYGKVPGLKETMQSEFIRVYNIFVEKANGVLDDLNRKFDELYPNYWKDNQDKDFDELTDYDQFIADSYQHLIVDELNKTNASPILEFYCNPEEGFLTGYLKENHNVRIYIE